MTKDESSKIVNVIMATWPKYYANFTPDMIDGLMDAWFGIMGEYTLEQGLAGLRSYTKADKRGFPPSPGQVATFIDKIESPQIARMNSLEAWGIVREAIRDSTYHAKERFEEFPPLIKKAVGNPSNLREWGQLSSEQVTNSVQSRFIKAYDALLKQADEVMSLPKDIRENMLSIAGKDAMLEITGNVEMLEVEE